MLLTANIHMALHTQRGFSDFRFGSPRFRVMGFTTACIIFQCTVDIRPVWKIAIFDLGEPCCAAGLIAGFANDGKNRLAVKLYFVRCQQGSSCWPVEATSLMPEYQKP